MRTLFVFAILLSACASDLSDEVARSGLGPESHLEALGEDALQTQLQGTLLRRREHTPGGVDLPLGYVELFCADGRWSQLGGRVTAFGRYAVRDSVVCVEPQRGSGNCRRFYRDGTGQIYTQMVESELPAIRVAFEPIDASMCG